MGISNDDIRAALLYEEIRDGKSNTYVLEGIRMGRFKIADLNAAWKIAHPKAKASAYGKLSVVDAIEAIRTSTKGPAPDLVKENPKSDPPPPVVAEAVAVVVPEEPAK